MKEITTNIWSFPQLVENGCVYVDKTDLLLKLIRKADNSFFISRPRRFGKSLMLSTLKAIFEGRKELFDGLKIFKSDYDWKTYPVLTLDMSDARGETYEDVKHGLNKAVVELAKELSIDLVPENSPSQSFLTLWNEIEARKLQVVVLVDEYDMPLQGFMDRPEEYEKVRQLLHDFYIHLKSHAPSIRFLMLTGVTKLAKLSIFSGLNSPMDLSMMADYASLLGYTHAELEEYFSEHLNVFAEKNNLSQQEAIRKILDWYDNYRFSAESKVCVINPVSVAYALITHVLENRWFETGQASLIIERMRKSGRHPFDYEGMPAIKSQLMSLDFQRKSVLPLMYQGGYLTIKDVDEVGTLILGVPNHEVRESLSNAYFADIIEDDNVGIFYANQQNAARALANGNLEKAIALFRSAISKLPFSWLIKDEGSVKVAFLMFFYPLRNTRIASEEEIASGKIDAVYEDDKNVFIFEFKYNKSAQEAFNQIIEKGYARPYLSNTSARHCEERSDEAIHKKVYGIGLNYNPNENIRGIDEPVVQVIKGST